MKNIVKKIMLSSAALLIIGVSFAACNANNNGNNDAVTSQNAYLANQKSDDFMFQKDGIKFSKGAYKYLLLQYYLNSYGYLEDFNKSIFEQQIEGVDGETWLKNQVFEAAKRSLLMDIVMKEAGLGVGDDTIKSAKQQAEDEYNGSYKEMYDNMGITAEDIYEANYLMQIKNSLYFEFLYTKGEKAIANDELMSYFNEHYIGVNYIIKPMYDENYNKYDDAKLDEIRNKYQSYVDEIKSGSKTMKDVAAIVATEDNEEFNIDYYTAENVLNTRALDLESDMLVYNGYPETFINALKEMEEGEIRLIEDDMGYFIIVQKRTAEETTKDFEDGITAHYDILVDMKSDEYSQYMTSLVESFEIEENEEALSSLNIKELLEPETHDHEETETNEEADAQDNTQEPTESAETVDTEEAADTAESES